MEMTEQSFVSPRPRLESFMDRNRRSLHLLRKWVVNPLTFGSIEFELTAFFRASCPNRASCARRFDRIERSVKRIFVLIEKRIIPVLDLIVGGIFVIPDRTGFRN
jgi:hypothetical protein